MRVTAVVLAFCLCTGAGSPRTDAGFELRGIDGLIRAYDFILEARFDQVDAELRKACGPAPREACEVLAATALWWRIQLDPSSRALDAEFSSTVDRAIESAAYAVRVQWRVLRDEKLSAARDGKRILEALEQAITLDPTIDDAYFGMGMYKYYAGVAPAAARMLRFLLLLPGGDKDRGLEEMLRARSKGRLLQGEADYQLSIIYLWYEADTARALELLQGLQKHYSGNPLFQAQIAQIQDGYLHDTMASLTTWRALLAGAREQRSNQPGLAEAQSRLEIARLAERLHQTDQAIEQLRAVIAVRPAAPFGALPLAYLRLGEAHDRLGERPQAVEAYRAALALAPQPDVHEIRSAATTRLRRAPDQRRGEAYRLSLEGWRRLEQNDVAGATASLERSLQLHNGDPVTRYRFGRVLQTREEDPAALVQFESVIRNAKACPPPVLGMAYLEAARLHERAGRRDQALSYYRITSTLFGAAAETRAAAQRALARVPSSMRVPRR
jgi:tetratricopeptide (TPR) repeat protein